MRTVLACVMALTVVSILTLCPLILCQPLAASCCHHQPSQSVPCPYTILEKSKANPTAHYTVAMHFLPASPAPCAAQHVSTVQNESRLLNAAGLFLRNRVLLI